MNESFKRSNGDARARRRASSMRRDRRAVFSFSRRRSARERWRANECRVAVDCAPLLRMCITQKSTRRDAESAGENVGLERVENDRR